MSKRAVLLPSIVARVSLTFVDVVCRQVGDARLRVSPSMKPNRPMAFESASKYS
jgi:hypothetical protein